MNRNPHFLFPPTQALQVKEETHNQNMSLVEVVIMMVMVLRTNPPSPEAWDNVHLTQVTEPQTL